MPLDFFRAVAEESGCELQQVRKMMKAVEKLLQQQLNENEYMKMPHVAIFSVKRKAARMECTRNCFGKEMSIAARPASMAIRAQPVKRLRDFISIDA